MEPSREQAKSHHNPGEILTARQIAELLEGQVEGDPNVPISGIAPIDQAQPHELGFLAQRKYLRFLAETRAGAILVSEALASQAETAPSRIVVKEAHLALPTLLATFYPETKPEASIHPTAVFEKGVALGKEVSVGPYSVLGEGVQVGDGARIASHVVVGDGCVVGPESVLHPHVVLYPGTKLGARVILHAGVKLGVDGFGYVPVNGENQKVPQVGACVVGDNVEIGANSCVDRGSIGRTVVGEGTKLDNLVHLAHNVQVGKGVLMAAMVGIAGSTRIGDHCLFGGQSGAVGHIEIGAGARVGAQAGIIGDLPAKETVSGFPARSQREFFRAMGMLYKLPETLRRLQDLEARVASLVEPEED